MFTGQGYQNIPNINILFPYGEYFQNEQMMQLAAYVGKKYQYTLKPSTLFLKSCNYPKLGRELMLLSMLPKYQATAAVEPKTEDAYLVNSQIMVASNKNWFVAAKGGNNAKTHVLSDNISKPLLQFGIIHTFDDINNLITSTGVLSSWEASETNLCC